MAESPAIDALVVGAGMGGIYSTYRLSRMGFNVHCIERGSDVGGTWYWNTYPGAMSDTETYLYRFSWDKEDLQTYPWTHHYVYQPEILEYIQHVVKRHDLRKYMHFNCQMESATWDESICRWRIVCSDRTFFARYLITAVGILAKVKYPKIAGLETFEGDILHTARWDHNVDLKQKKVGVIGNGSSGVQVMTAIAPIVRELVSFQRHPQYSVPSCQGPVSPEYRQKINENYDKIWESVFESSVGFGHKESTRKTMEATPEERQQAFQDVWDKGNGFRFLFGAFGDLTTNEEANEEACKFIRGKIDEIVKDRRKASILKPKELYARRPLCDSGYYDMFNRNNVDVVDLKANPIKEITAKGVKLSDGSVHELDILILATGFDALVGSYSRVCVKGREGKTLKDHWEYGPTAYGGVSCPGFPNMFLVGGPQGPFSNFPPSIESEVDFIMKCIEHAEATSDDDQEYVNGSRNDQANGKGDERSSGVARLSKKQRRVMEVTAEAESAWSEHCQSIASGSVFVKSPSWLFGENIPGRKVNVGSFYFGGLKLYRDWVKREVSEGFPGFHE